MKTQNQTFSLLAAFVFMFSAVSCSNNNDDNIPIILPVSIQNQVQTNAQSGNWRITKFVDSGTDETSNFAGYIFKFNTNGVINVSSGSNGYDGAWNISDSNSNDDTQDDLHFNINFSITNDFDDLSDDWNFVSQSPSKIELIDVSGGNGGTDYLTFEKN